MSAFAAYTGTVSITTTDSPQAAAPNSALPFGVNSNTTTITGKSSYKVGGNLVQGVNEVATNVLSVTANSSATFNLQALTDMLGQTNVSLVRLKRYVFWLLSPNDDATAGTNCTGVTISGGAVNPNVLNMGGTTPNFTLNGNSTDSGDKQCWASTTAAGITVSGTALNVLVSNLDASHAAALYYNLAGSTT